MVIKRILLKTGAVVLSILLYLVCLEVMVRVFHLAEPRYGQQDAVLGTAYIPGTTAVNNFGVKIEIGEHAHRGPTPAVEKKPGVFRVVLLGDSFLQASAIEYEDVFYSILNREFKARGLPIEVINMGVAGYSTIQEYLLFHHQAVKYKPDLVILFFSVHNDLIENYPPQEFKPGYKLTNGELEYVPFEVKGGRRNFLRDFCRKHFRVYTYLPDLVRTKVELIKQKLGLEEQPHGFEEHRIRFEEWADVLNTENVLSLDPQGEAWQVTLKIIEKLNQEVKAGGGRLALVVFPSVTQTYDRYWNVLEKKRQDAGLPGLERFRPERILEDLAHRTDILYIPFSRPMAESARKEGKTYFIPADFHFDKLGHQLIAKALAPAIEKLYREALDRAESGPGTGVKAGEN